MATGKSAFIRAGRAGVDTLAGNGPGSSIAPSSFGQARAGSADGRIPFHRYCADESAISDQSEPALDRHSGRLNELYGRAIVSAADRRPTDWNQSAHSLFGQGAARVRHASGWNQEMAA